eukprot:COSAG03_NODE_16744_length_393_cov_0.877551_1_plen_69_part_01
MHHRLISRGALNRGLHTPHLPVVAKQGRPGRPQSQNCSQIDSILKAGNGHDTFWLTVGHVKCASLHDPR